MLGIFLTNTTLIGDATDALNTASGVLQNAETIKNINIVTNLLYMVILICATIITLLWKHISKQSEKAEQKDKEIGVLIESIRTKNAIAIAEVTEKYNNKIDEIRVETMNSERNTLQVLNGVSKIIEMGEKTGRYDSEKILAQIASLETRVMDKLNNLSNNID